VAALIGAPAIRIALVPVESRIIVVELIVKLLPGILACIGESAIIGVVVMIAVLVNEAIILPLGTRGMLGRSSCKEYSIPVLSHRIET
jgi:hypothetical protein